MDQLNSVLLEGILTKDPILTEMVRSKDRTVVPSCEMEILNERNLKSIGHSRLKIRVFAYDQLGTVCQEYLAAGRGIRVVGRLVGAVGTDQKEKGLYIEAEHLEFKPKTEQPAVREAEELKKAEASVGQG